jgi:aldehyde dehydrogenase (NAD+)
MTSVSSTSSASGTIADRGARLEEARRIFALQQAHRWEVARSTAAERAAKLARLKDAIVSHRETVHEAMWADFHKHAVEVELTEIAPALLDLDHARSNVAGWMQPSRVGGHWLLAGTRSEVRHEARGVVLIMAPWNYPFGLLVTPLIAAVAAGNCAILRPSEKVPHTAAVLQRIVRQAFDEREVACVTEEGIEVAQALLAMPFDHMFFTGSTNMGRRVMTAAATYLATVTLELGGKSPLIVDESADVRGAGERAAWGKFVNAGQTCIAPDYAVVHERVRDAFVAAAKDAIVRFYGPTEEARQASPYLARIIDPPAFERLQQLLKDSVSAGARVEIGGRADAAERYIAPTILTGVAWDGPPMREEIFGPILPVLTYSSIDEVIARINARGKPLALYVFSRNEAFVDRVLEKTSSGATSINQVLLHFANPNLPFGGVGESGQGSYHGHSGFRAFSHERALLRQGRFATTGLLYPPYNRVTRRAVKLLGRLIG